jgi:hypothetical protein
LYQITNVTLSCDAAKGDDNDVGNKSHGNVTSNPVALWTSDNGPGMIHKKEQINYFFPFTRMNK